MPTFSCQTCDASFSVPQATIDRFPGWTPRFCRAHSPAKQSASTKRGGSKKRSRKSAGSGEGELTPAQVLARHTGGPQDGVFTDGSSVPNPGPGGWGVVWVRDGKIVEERHGHDAATTNNRMEMTALIEAFRLLPEDAAVTVWTDSKLCMNTIETWAAAWEKRGWVRKTGPIKNLDLVKEVFALRKAHPQCRVQWIAAHSGHRWNEYADSLASSWQRGS